MAKLFYLEIPMKQKDYLMFMIFQVKNFIEKVTYKRKNRKLACLNFITSIIL